MSDLKQIPVTSQLYSILQRSRDYYIHDIAAVEDELKKEPLRGNSAELVALGLEDRRQQLAIIKDLLERYK